MSIDSLMNVNTKLPPDQGEFLEDAGRYMRLVEKLNYLTVIRLDNIFAISVVSQFLSASRTTHLESIMRILRYLKKAPGRGLVYSNQRHSRLACFSDTDWEMCPFDKRSTT